MENEINPSQPTYWYCEVCYALNSVFTDKNKLCNCEPMGESITIKGNSDIFSNVKQICICNKRLYFVDDMAILAFNHQELFDILEGLYRDPEKKKDLKKFAFNGKLKILWDNKR